MTRCPEHFHRQPCPMCRAEHLGGDHRARPNPDCTDCKTPDSIPDRKTASTGETDE